MVNSKELDSGEDVEVVNEGWPSIPEYYAGRSVFVTGGSGFMGKVLIEKLLRSCPDVRTIFLLLRPKKGKGPGERVQELGADPLFERLRTEQPSALSKLQVVCGDVKHLGLGLSEQDRQMLQAEVSVVFHSAASVRFDDPLRDAVLTNVRGTRELLILAQQMPQLEVFLHLSTTFCNCDKSEVFEEIYPAPGSWRTVISFVENSKDSSIVRCLTPKLLGALPNTYTYAKALAEQLINDYKDKLPILIVRPSIVVCTAEEPIVGWCDNLNGPMGIWVGVYTGVLRAIFVDKHQKLDFVPVDTAIKSMIFLAWYRGVIQPRRMEKLPVYNCCMMTEQLSHVTFMEYGQTELHEHPTMRSIWYPPSEWSLIDNYPYYFVCVLLFHMLPAIVLDNVLRAAGRKPMLVKLYRRIFIANDALSFFTTREFKFNNTKFLETGRFMLPCDREDFCYTKIINLDAVSFRKGVLMSRANILKDPLSTRDAAQKRMKRLYVLDRGLKGAFMMALTWVLVNSNLAQSAFSALLASTRALFTG